MLSAKDGQRQDKKIGYYIKSAIWFFVAVAILAVGGWFLMRGTVTKEGSNPDPVSADAINCVNDELRYPYIEKKYGEIFHTIKVDMIFESGEISTIGLSYDTEYENEKQAEEALEMVTSEFNITMNKMGIDKNFISNVKFTKNNNHIITNIYTHKAEMTQNNKKLLLIDDGSETKSKDYLVQNYEKQGFSCQVRNR